LRAINSVNRSRVTTHHSVANHLPRNISISRKLLDYAYIAAGRSAVIGTDEREEVAD
jgi:hypothetical protein